MTDKTTLDMIVLAHEIAALDSGVVQEDQFRTWQFGSCAAASRFTASCEAAGLQWWRGADLAGLVLPGDAAWESPEPPDTRDPESLDSLKNNREFQRQLQVVTMMEARLRERTRIAIQEPNFAAKIGLLVDVTKTADELSRIMMALACMRRALAEPRRPSP